MNDESETTNDARQAEGLPLLVVPQQQKLTPAQAWRKVAVAFGLFLLGMCLFAYVAQGCWNTLTGVTGLPEVTWQEAFCAVLLLRVAVWTARL